MRPIDADVLKEKKAYCVERHEKVVPVAEIDWMPTLDAVPVIRCAKCKYYGPGDHAGFWRCENWGVDINRQASPPETFYCADGEPKEEET